MGTSDGRTIYSITDSSQKNASPSSHSSFQSPINEDREPQYSGRTRFLGQAYQALSRSVGTFDGCAESPQESPKKAAHTSSKTESSQAKGEK
jgi:hypothetical protein